VGEGGGREKSEKTKMKKSWNDVYGARDRTGARKKKNHGGRETALGRPRVKKRRVIERND